MPPRRLSPLLRARRRAWDRPFQSLTECFGQLCPMPRVAVQMQYRVAQAPYMNLESNFASLVSSTGAPRMLQACRLAVKAEFSPTVPARFSNPCLSWVAVRNSLGYHEASLRTQSYSQQSNGRRFGFPKANREMKR